MNKLLNISTAIVVLLFVGLLIWQENVIKEHQIQHQKDLKTQAGFEKKLVGHKVIEFKRIEEGEYHIKFDTGDTMIFVGTAFAERAGGRLYVFFETKEEKAKREKEEAVEKAKEGKK